MVTIKRIYLEPDDVSGYAFPPIEFDTGINFILGERAGARAKDDNPERNKMNGVGKSVLVEIIDYCFLKDLSKSRLSYIPTPLISDSTMFCMDLEVVLNDLAQNITIKRSRLRKGADVRIVVDGEEAEFDKLDDARDFLERYVVLLRDSDSPSLRRLLSILLRHEKTLYGDIFYTDSNSKLYPYSDLLRPHLYLFGVRLDIIEDIKKTLLEKKDVQKAISLVNADFKAQGISADEVKAHLRDLEDKLETLSLAIEGLAPAEVSIQKKQELRDHLIELDQLTSARVSKEYLLRKIQSLPKTKSVDAEKLGVVYNAFKQGLGDLVTTTFNEVIEFRKEIEQFQTDLIINKQKELRDEIRELNTRIGRVDAAISEYYKANIAREKLDDLTEAAVSQREKDKQLTALRYKYDVYEDNTKKKEELQRSLNKLYDELGVQLFELEKVLRSFNDDLSDIHAAIAGNKRCQFDLKLNPKSQQYIQANYRIKLDGSMGIDRIKTFIYDVLLMTNERTSVRHPGFLIHDNIFAATGKDDMVKALNYLYGLEKKSNFQYIVTINKDEFESYSDEFDFKVDEKVKKTLTRHEPLFGHVYDEVK